MRKILVSLMLAVGIILWCARAENAANSIPAQESGTTRVKQRKDFPDIVFVGTPIFDEETEGGKGVWQGSYHWRDSYIYARSATYHRAERTKGPVRPGKNLYALIKGKMKRLTHLKTGAVFKPEPYFDGTKVLFSMRRDGEDWFHLYEININGSGLKQLTDGPFNDFAGVYLPDDRIVFCSDRTGYLEEYHEERTETLFTMNGDGSGIEQITFTPGTYFEPILLKDGRILFSFWDAFHIDVPPFDKHETFLMTVNPDGTEERHFFGNGQYQFFNRERHSGVGLTQPREMPDGRILVQSEMGPSLLDLRAGLEVRDALVPIFPGTTSIQLGGTTHRSHLSPLGTRSTAYPLANGKLLFSKTAPGARDSGIYLCDPDTREEELVLNIPNYAEFDAVPVGVKRPRPKRLPNRQGGMEGGTTRFLVVAGKYSDNPNRTKALEEARFFRVIEAEYTGVTTSSHTNLETRILGVVPIHQDGSAYFEAPADTPIFLDPLDAAGNRLLMEWNYPNTSVEAGTHYPATQMAYMVGRAGETRSCYGCHATQTEVVDNRTLSALKYSPVQVSRQSRDLQYRRNEPNAYRRQARIGDAKVYLPWLRSKDPERRARACEMLMYLEDEVGQEVKTVAGLLEDENAKVRRSAALALTRLATIEQKTALEKALQDSDWQVRFSAKAALDGLQLFRNYQEELQKPIPDVRAIQAAGKQRDPTVVQSLIPWLKNHKYEYHAAEAAIALGRIGTQEAKKALWAAMRTEVPLKKVHISRYLQRGPRPEEYALLRGLLLAKASALLNDVYLLIALLPNTFMEKPRFEDRLRSESQRVLMPRLLLERSGLRKKAVAILTDCLRGNHPEKDPLYQQILKGINLERPFSEHGRRFPVVAEIGPEEALWLLSCLIDPKVDLSTPEQRQSLEQLIVPNLTSENHRQRIDGAVLLGRIGFGKKTAAILAREIAEPYSFPEITSIGQGMPGTPFRDKAYLMQTLARHIKDVKALKPFANPKSIYRDIRYGLVRGLARRGKTDAIPLLKELATQDPLTLIRQQARYALADIQDQCRLLGKKVPDVTLPDPLPLEAHYPPRKLVWTDKKFKELPQTLPVPNEAEEYSDFLKDCLRPGNFRNLNMAQARGAQRMMIKKVEETRLAGKHLAKVLPDKAGATYLQWLNSPYPYLNYLAARKLANHPNANVVDALLKALETNAKKGNTVGFWWCCDSLAKLKAKKAIPLLAKFAVAENPTGTYGPPGMASGYVSARTISYLLGDTQHKMVIELLKSDSIWLRAGTLRGLAESRAPGVRRVLNLANSPDSPALVRYEAQVQLNRLRNDKD